MGSVNSKEKEFEAITARYMSKGFVLPGETDNALELARYAQAIAEFNAKNYSNRQEQTRKRLLRIGR